ncbi:hypothetical protein Dda_1667 [Drechslerella dactyloides]|uniref:Uncharacterized protein n=1 Tax=Drechslerella dactyloides TaxID=74499 RepID=A0AAD6NNA4_DREDA|nr:hypothetical protein Dda_1667 [Drechslerella dactyloides]
MPVTVHPSNVKAEEYRFNEFRAKDAAGVLRLPLQKGIPYKCKELLQSTFTQDLMSSRNITPSSSSFVNSAINAYSFHHHLVIRPDDVWITILTQFSFYVNKHAEELRSMFVAHEGKKELTITGGGERHTFDVGRMTVAMGELIQENVIDPDLRAWLIPEFSTTEANDKIVASAIMMATLQEYFTYTMMLLCGLPGVTLLGEKRDWEALLHKLDKFDTFGEETSRFANLLRPIIRRFVKCFDDPESQELKDFWMRVVEKTGGSGPTYLTGWITAFCFWNKKGEVQYQKAEAVPSFMGSPEGLTLDDQVYGTITEENVSEAYAYVPVKLDDNGVEFDTALVAGMVAVESRPTVERDEAWEAENRQRKSEGDGKERSGPVCSVIQPMSGWFFFEREDSGQEKPDDDLASL